MNENTVKTTKIDPWVNYSLFVALVSLVLYLGIGKIVYAEGINYAYDGEAISSFFLVSLKY